MGTFNVTVALNKKQTMFFAKIRNEKNEIINELIEEVSSLGPKLHQKFLNKQCIDWIKTVYQEPVGNIPSTTENISGGCSMSEPISGGSIL
jgi:hypothetical protein